MNSELIVYLFVIASLAVIAVVALVYVVWLLVRQNEEMRYARNYSAEVDSIIEKRYNEQLQYP